MKPKRSLVTDVHTLITVVSTFHSAVLRAPVFIGDTHTVVVSCHSRLCYDDVGSSSCAVVPLKPELGVITHILHLRY